MGGGIVSKNKFVSENGELIGFFRCSDQSTNWICGGCFPAFSSSLDYLISENIGLSVTLTLEPIKSGRNINHVPSNHDCTEWVDGDDLEDKLKNFSTLHIPIDDAGFPTEENAIKLLEGVQKYHQENPNKSVYFHCWAGKGRTSLAICYILIKMYDMNCDDAINRVMKYNSRCNLSPSQLDFLRGNIKSEDVPIIKTPSDHKCYQL